MYKVEYTKRFLKELAGLPHESQAQAEKIVFEDLPSKNPFQLGCVEQMSGYPDKYKIRIGSYRIGMTINKTEKIIMCQRVAHRKDIYRTFPE